MANSRLSLYDHLLTNLLDRLTYLVTPTTTTEPHVNILVREAQAQLDQIKTSFSLITKNSAAFFEMRAHCML